jgi:hypothetical protein
VKVAQCHEEHWVDSRGGLWGFVVDNLAWLLGR